VFNSGHDQAADLWSLAVLVYEMIMTVTPFAPKNPDNVSEVFRNIGRAKVSMAIECLLGCWVAGLRLVNLHLIFGNRHLAEKWGYPTTRIHRQMSRNPFARRAAAVAEPRPG
jgi:hypothetical protein